MSAELDKIIRQSFYEGWSWHKATLDPLNRVGQKQEDESVEKTTKAIEAYISKHYIRREEVEKIYENGEEKLLKFVVENGTELSEEFITDTILFRIPKEKLIKGGKS